MYSPRSWSRCSTSTKCSTSWHRNGGCHVATSSNENLGIRDPLPAQPARGAKALGRSHPGPGATATAFDLDNTVDWGGPDRPNDYYITGDSLPARLGSSLGWLLQLDGDNLRNAFLNTPWVKAVIPIHADHEWKALEWLSSPEIEGNTGLQGLYQARSG